MATSTSLGGALRAARLRAGKTAVEVAALIGRGPLAVYRWEWDKSRPAYGELQKLAEVYGLTVGQLVDGAEPAEARQA